MLKLFGILLIVAAGSGIGFSQSFALTRREKALRQLHRMSVLLKGEIQYGNASLWEAFEGAAGKMQGEYRDFLKETARRMQSASCRPFEDIFRECAREKLADAGLSREEEEDLYALGAHLGYLDLAMQIKQLELYQWEVQRSIGELQEQMPGKKKIYQSLGIMGGILLAVLIW